MDPGRTGRGQLCNWITTITEYEFSSEFHTAHELQKFYHEIPACYTHFRTSSGIHRYWHSHCTKVSSGSVAGTGSLTMQHPLISLAWGSMAALLTLVRPWAPMTRVLGLVWPWPPSSQVHTSAHSAPGKPPSCLRPFLQTHIKCSSSHEISPRRLAVLNAPLPDNPQGAYQSAPSSRLPASSGPLNASDGLSSIWRT